MPGPLFKKPTGQPAEDLHAQGAADYKGSGLDFFPVRHKFGSHEWLAWSGGVVEEWKAEQSEEKAGQS